jgi:hypothetical protein
MGSNGSWIEPDHSYARPPAQSFSLYIGCLTVGGSCASVNPRRTPWYAASISGSKNVIILLDAGDSGTSLKSRMSSAVSVVLDTISSIDYFTIIAIFNGKAASITGSAGLLQGTEENVDNVEAAMQAMYVIAEPHIDLFFIFLFSRSKFSYASFLLLEFLLDNLIGQRVSK